MSYRRILYHLVFSTKDRAMVLKTERREELFRYIWGIVKNKNGHLYRINGVEDHVHILSDLHPSLALADFIKSIKISSNEWIRREKIFPLFSGWQEGYSAFTHALKDKDYLIEYIKQQPEHHRRISFIEELRALLVEAGIEYDEKYLA
jgi:REP element-mobilizing transposase RayT